MSRFDHIRGLVQTPVTSQRTIIMTQIWYFGIRFPSGIYCYLPVSTLGGCISLTHALMRSPGSSFFSPTRLEIIPRYSNDDCGFEFKALSTGLIRYKYLSVLVVSYKICQSCFISIGMFQNLIFIRVWLSYICDCLLSRYLSNHYPQSRPFYSLNSFFLLYFFGPFI